MCCCTHYLSTIAPSTPQKCHSNDSNDLRRLKEAKETRKKSNEDNDFVCRTWFFRLFSLLLHAYVSSCMSIGNHGTELALFIFCRRALIISSGLVGSGQA